MNIGKQWNWRLQPWKPLILGMWLIDLIITYQPSHEIQMQTLSRWTYQEVQSTFLCKRQWTAWRNWFFRNIRNSHPMDNNMTNVQRGDSVRIEVKPSWCYLRYPSCRSWTRWKYLCWNVPWLCWILEERIKEVSQIEEYSLRTLAEPLSILEIQYQKLKTWWLE